MELDRREETSYSPITQCHDEKGLGIGFDSASQPFGRPSTATLSSTIHSIHYLYIRGRQESGMGYKGKRNPSGYGPTTGRTVQSRTPVRDGRDGGGKSPLEETDLEVELKVDVSCIYYWYL